MSEEFRKKMQAKRLEDIKKRLEKDPNNKYLQEKVKRLENPEEFRKKMLAKVKNRLKKNLVVAGEHAENDAEEKVAKVVILLFIFAADFLILQQNGRNGKMKEKDIKTQKPKQKRKRREVLSVQSQRELIKKLKTI